MTEPQPYLHPLTKKLKDFLENVNYTEVFHDEASTCQASAKARGMDLKFGAKTVLFKHKNEFSLFVISAAKHIDSNKVRKILKCQKLRFANDSEFLEISGTVKGALPPFGKPIFELAIYFDYSIQELEYICFNAGVLTHSFILDGTDFRKLQTGAYYDFAKS